MKAKLIIVQGPPASGKTTLATKISQDLGLPVVAKDGIKEYLFDTVGTRDREWSRVIDGISIQAMYVIAEGLLAHGETIILESAFYTDAAHDELEGLVQRAGAQCLEIFCTANADVRRERFQARNEGGGRHAGHVDHTNYDVMSDEAASKYTPIDIAGAEQLTVDTTQFHEEDYQKLLADVAVFVQA